MAHAGLQAPDIPATPTPHALQQPIQQVQQMPHLNWSQFKPEFSENLKKVQKLIYIELMIG